MKNGNKLVLFEHINLNIPHAHRKKAMEFYTQVLGCSVHPTNTGPRQIHVNSGLSQFHLPFRDVHIDKDIQVAQVWRGEIKLASKKDNVDSIADPFGNKFGLTQIQDWNPFAFGSHEGPKSQTLGIIEATHFCQPNTSARIAKFFEYIFGATVSCEKSSSTVYFGGAPLGTMTQSLIFQECEINSGERNAYDIDEKHAYHIAFYVDDIDTFCASYDRCEALDLVFVNQRFEAPAIPPRFRSAKSKAEAIEFQQFRVKDIIDLETGELLLSLEQEVRFPDHPCYPIGNIRAAL